MSDYRNFIRPTSGGFDGTTPELDNQYIQTGFVFNTTQTDPVGIFGPTSLKRFNVASLARIMLQGTIDAMTDSIEILDTDGQTRYSAPASLVTSGWLFLGPEDRIKITASGATSADILINDLTDEQLQTWILATATIPVPAFPQQSITVTATQDIPAYEGQLIVHINNAVDAILTLPALDDSIIGSRISFIKDAGAGEASIEAEDAADEVNGQTGIAATQYFLRSFGDSIDYLRVEDGWQREFGDQVFDQFDSADVNPIEIPAFTGGTLYVTDNSTTLGTAVTLPDIADGKQGIRIVIQNLDTKAHIIRSADGATINGATDIIFPGGSTVTVEQGKTDWFAYGGEVTVQGLQAIVAPGAINSTGGDLIVTVNLAADGTITLPSVSTNLHNLGKRISIIRIAGVGTVTIDTNAAGTTVNGVTTLAATRYFLRSIGDSITYTAVPGGWQREFGDQANEELTVGTNPITLVAVKGGKQHIFDTGTASGNVTSLPALATVPEGAGYLLFNTDTFVHVVTPSAGNTINGFSTRVHNNGEVMYVEASPSGWLAVGGGNQGEGLTSAASEILTPAQVTGKIYCREMTGLSGQSIQLPLSTSCAVGSEVIAYNNSANPHTITISGADLLNGVNAAIQDNPQDRTRIINMGAAGWVTVAAQSRTLDFAIQNIDTTAGLQLTFCPSQLRGKIAAISVCANSQAVTGTAILTFAINGVNITTGVVTITTTDPAGTNFTVIPTGNNTLNIGDVVGVALTGTNTAAASANASLLVRTQG